MFSQYANFTLYAVVVLAVLYSKLNSLTGHECGGYFL